MKFAYYIFGLLLLAQCSLPEKADDAVHQAACINTDPKSLIKVPVYKNPVTEDTLFTIMNIENYDVTHLYDVIVVEKSPLRFRVKFIDNADNDTLPRTGWVDKKYVGVWERWYWDEERRIHVRLFKEPYPESEYEKIYGFPETKLILLEFTPDGEFVQVMFMIGERTYIGWLDKFCVNIYNTIWG